MNFRQISVFSCTSELNSPDLPWGQLVEVVGVLRIYARFTTNPWQMGSTCNLFLGINKEGEDGFYLVAFDM